MPATRNQLLARLHCIRRDRGWSEDEYRDILQIKTRTEAHPGYRSGGDMPAPVLARLVAELDPQNSAPARRREHEWFWVDTAPTSKRPLLRKLIVLAGPKGANIARGHQVAYIEGIARQMNGIGAGAGPVTKPLRMCDEAELWRIVQALAVYLRRQRTSRGVTP